MSWGKAISVIKHWNRRSIVKISKKFTVLNLLSTARLPALLIMKTSKEEAKS